jgi:hypothetical protein
MAATLVITLEGFVIWLAVFGGGVIFAVWALVGLARDVPFVLLGSPVFTGRNARRAYLVCAVAGLGAACGVSLFLGLAMPP